MSKVNYFLAIVLFIFSGLNSYSQVKGIANRPPGPFWIDNAVFYEIYPQTFYDSDGDGVGDLKGIIAKLDYVKSLGVNAIWLNPFYESPFRDAGYDVSDYYKVAPRYGTNADAKKLFDEVHKRGMHIIIDYVPGHTSIDHPWFKASALPLKNKFSNWYIWTNDTFEEYDKCRLNFVMGYSNRNGNYLSNFFWHQPALNYGFAHPDPNQSWQLAVDNPDVLALKKEMENVLRFWLDMGCDGFRVDMAGSLIKEDSGEACIKYWRGIRNMLNRDYPNAYLVSEWSFPKSAIAGGFNADFFHWFKGFSDLFGFFDHDGKGNIARFMDLYMEQYRAVKDSGYVAIPMANHDLSRLRRNGGRTLKDVEIIHAFELTMPGNPFFYYGDEIGMKQIEGLPFTEGSYGTRAGARTPMQWTNGLNDGFSKAKPSLLYRAVDTTKNAPSVAASDKDSASLLNQVRKLIQLRKAEPALTAFAEFVPLYAETNKYPFVYLRANGKDRILVALNPSHEQTEASFTISYAAANPVLIFGNGEIVQKNGRITLKLKGTSYALFRLNELTK